MSPTEQAPVPAVPASPATPKNKSLRHDDTVRVFETPPELIPAPSQRIVRLSADAFPPSVAKGAKGSKSKKSAQAHQSYLIIGFDTEFKMPDHMVTREEIVAGEAKYRVLSYQFHAKTSDGREWQGICCPAGTEWMTLAAFMVFALGLGVEDHGYRDLPTKIYLVGHFTRADVPAFDDFSDLSATLSNVRNTFVSVDSSTVLELRHGQSVPDTKLQILFRDTLLLTPRHPRARRL